MAEDGKWYAPARYGDTGKYIPSDEGKYVHIPNPYIHIHNPYGGGFGPYAHQNDPYKGEESQQPQYKLVIEPPKDIPFYRPGYYHNNGIKIIRQNHDLNEDKYKFLYETENSILAEENAKLKNIGDKDEGIASAGYYQYIGPDGYLYRVDYTADENGFRPKVTRLTTKYSGKHEYVRV